MATNRGKRISQLTALTSASLNTTIVGVDNGTTYKIELDTLADAVTSRVNILDRDRLESLENYTASFSASFVSGTISSSAQITALGFVSSSTIIPIGTISSSAQISNFGFISSSHTDITSLNSFTSSQSILNTAFTNGISARLQTSSFNYFSSSIDSRVDSLESWSSSLATTGSNTFTGNNTFNGSVVIGPGGGSEGGQIDLAYSPTGNTLTGSTVSLDIYQNQLRIFENGGNARGVSIDLSKAPASVGGELLWKASGFVNAGTFVTLDNLKCTVTTSGQRGLSIGAVSGSFEADLSGWYGGQSVGTAGSAANNLSYNTTASTSLFGWSFPAHGDTAQYQIRDKTNNRFYRVTMMIGASYLNNFISIERLF
jgi:hypothetical protein